jgi:hypothetical protein
VASMEQHEKLVKDTHDFLAEASEQFKTALTKQVRVMGRHHDRHEILKESTAALANSARKRFRDISLGALSDHPLKDTDWRTRKVWAESMLASVDEEHKKALDGWIEERKALHEKIKCMDEECKKLKADREKLTDQVSEHALRNHQRSQKQVEEKAVERPHYTIMEWSNRIKYSCRAYASCFLAHARKEMLLCWRTKISRGNGRLAPAHLHPHLSS